MARFFRWLAFLALIGLAVFWWVTAPERVDAAALAGLTGDAAKGERLWEFDPRSVGSRVSGVNRGVVYWEDGDVCFSPPPVFAVRVRLAPVGLR